MPTTQVESGELELDDDHKGAQRARRVVALVDDDALPDMKPVAVEVPEAPAAKPVPSGYPDPERADEVQAERRNHARLADALRSVAQQRADLAAAMGVRPEWSVRHIEHIAPQLLAAGATFEMIDRFKALTQREQQTREACKQSADEVGLMLNEARRKLAGRAAAEMFRPAEREEARALLAFLAAREKKRQVLVTLRAAGIEHAVSGVITADFCTSTTGQNPTLLRLVESGHLTREEVRAALPAIHGV